MVPRVRTRTINWKGELARRIEGKYLETGTDTGSCDGIASTDFLGHDGWGDILLGRGEGTTGTGMPSNSSGIFYLLHGGGQRVAML